MLSARAAGGTAMWHTLCADAHDVGGSVALSLFMEAWALDPTDCDEHTKRQDGHIERSVAPLCGAVLSNCQLGVHAHRSEHDNG